MSAYAAPKVIPAQLAFLAIYNPTLGPTDETFPQQCVFWYSRAAQEARAAAKRSGKSDAAGGDAAAREEENEKLRQIGLAQGMVDFARSFSDGQPVDAVETEKSRVVLHELEPGWWILASIDLTRLPTVAPASSEPAVSKKGAAKVEQKPTYEYSSREVSPAPLLIQQLLQAHYVFSLHHGPSLDDLYVRLPKDKFWRTLDRFWTRFSRSWDVLLHGNPSADIFSGIKVASGGELGVGVGEEEWGSGEREVLEDIVRNTEGLIDLMVSRFGEPPAFETSDYSNLPEHEVLPWMGIANQPMAPDGIVFSGVGALARPSLRNISLWMRQIYTYGEHAYGVRDNPLRETRRRRRRNPLREASEQANGEDLTPKTSRDLNPNGLKQTVQEQEAVKQHDEPGDKLDPFLLPHDPRPRIHGRTASQDHAAEQAEHTPPIIHNPPGIPPPIVAAVDQALEKATRKADQDGKHKPEADEETSESTWGVPNQYMKYLTLGLSEIGRSRNERLKQPSARPPAPKQVTSNSSQATIKALRKKDDKIANAVKSPVPTDNGHAHIDSKSAEDELKAKIAVQKRLENRGHFVIGLKGDLDAVPYGDDAESQEVADATDGSVHAEAQGTRNVLRTLQVELSAQVIASSANVSDEEHINDILNRKAKDATSETTSQKKARRVRVLVYAHRPFMYCFIFEQRAGNLSYASFYRKLHRNLVTIHRPMLSSTNQEKVAQLIEASHAEATGEQSDDKTSVLSSGTNSLPSRGAGSQASHDARPIFDLIHDPTSLTVHCSVPNIPDPGTPAAEGLGFSVGDSKRIPAGWSRAEALNVHSAILNTLASVKGKRAELERTSKTSRGWWVVWMKMPPSHAFAEKGGLEREDSNATLQGNDDNAAAVKTSADDGLTKSIASTQPQHPDESRTAFLVRRSAESTAPRHSNSKSASGVRTASQGLWNSTLSAFGAGSSSTSEAKTGGASVGWGPGRTGSKTGGEADGILGAGIGSDARKYVEGLMSLGR
ncbi:hypothetical protein EJ03DRAFT_331403 [Teratosphaeria nubilosa]|uniref:CCZ1/INTU/HSP4 first Longin domain-containing protein n=1 Tax=Teratosphaeria nubilosa TaxID=161662 RepID=A0A6G1KXP6_9PEZI|nr:hypothetical protein EJ03DRAFT_331403 [Teratosphaeria nubilosa]